MGVEIERKFLVDYGLLKFETSLNHQNIIQAYVMSDEDKILRIRKKNNHGFLAIKQKSSTTSRFEYEYSIPPDDVVEMITVFGLRNVIHKTRCIHYHDGFKWEVDHFHRDNEGLIIAEIELRSEHQQFTLPPWVKQEVTQDVRFYNENLSLNPAKNWFKGEDYGL